MTPTTLPTAPISGHGNADTPRPEQTAYDLDLFAEFNAGTRRARWANYDRSGDRGSA